MVDLSRSPLWLAWLPVPPRVAMMFAAMFFITGVTTPFLPVWLADRGLTAGEIGVMMTLPSLIRSLVAPFVGWEADRRQAHRALVISLGILGTLAWGLLWRASGFGVALLALVLVSLSTIMTPLVEAIAVAGVRDSGHDYGRMRSWGSLSFVVANLLGSWVAGHVGIAPLIVPVLCGAVATVAIGVLLPQPLARDAGTAVRAPLSWHGILEVVGVPLMVPLLLAAGALQGAHGFFYAYGTLHWRALGVDPGWFGVLWAVGLITEITLFWWSQSAVRRFGAAWLMVAGGMLGTLRWCLMAFDPPLPWLVPLQMLHGLTFGLSHLGAMHVLAKITPPRNTATAQTLYALVSTWGVVGATALSSQLYPIAGGKAYLAMAGLAAIGLLAALQVANSPTSEPQTPSRIGV